MFIALALENFNRWDSCKWKTTQRNLCLVKLSVSNEPLQSMRKCFFSSVLIKKSQCIKQLYYI